MTLRHGEAIATIARAAVAIASAVTNSLGCIASGPAGKCICTSPQEDNVVDAGERESIGAADWRIEIATMVEGKVEAGDRVRIIIDLDVLDVRTLLTDTANAVSTAGEAELSCAFASCRCTLHKARIEVGVVGMIVVVALVVVEDCILKTSIIA